MAACLSASSSSSFSTGRKERGQEGLTDETIRVIPPQVLERLPRIVTPLSLGPVRLHRVDEMTPSVLQCDRIPVVVEHGRDEIDGVRVEGKGRVVDYSQGVQLMAECCFGNDELGGIGAAEGGFVSEG
jgi:hypothetical protein